MLQSEIRDTADALVVLIRALANGVVSLHVTPATAAEDMTAATKKSCFRFLARRWSYLAHQGYARDIMSGSEGTRKERTEKRVSVVGLVAASSAVEASIGTAYTLSSGTRVVW